MLKTGLATVSPLVLLLIGNAYAVDTGDAPVSYGSATHIVVDGAAFLGDVPPDDNEPFFDGGAQADDTDGLDDEGGVFAFPDLLQNGKAYDANVFATNPGDVDATLIGWVDFDGNGVFDADEATTETVPAGTDNGKFKLVWPNLSGITTDHTGTTYARFRVSTGPLTSIDGSGAADDGEVEDYSLEILRDSDGDERPDISDTDNDNDGIPDAIEGGDDVDTDNDGLPDYLDTDSDSDLIPDYIEAGSNPLIPVDTDGDGQPDYLDLDSNGDNIPDSQVSGDDADRDGIPNAVEGIVDTDGDGVLDMFDMDSDNDTIPDVIEAGEDPQQPVDTDGDGIADFIDGDSDNDGIVDIREANSGEVNVALLDADNNGRVDADLITGVNGLVDEAETEADSGVPRFSVADTDQNGVRDFRQLDSDNDGVSDLLEAGGIDIDSDGLVDSTQDLDGDGIIDGENVVSNIGSLPDLDEDFTPDFQDADSIGLRPDSNSETPVTTDSPQVPDTLEPSQDDSPSPEDDGVVDDGSGIIETGLSGGPGCSIAGYGGQTAAANAFYAVLVLLSIVILALRRVERTRY